MDNQKVSIITPIYNSERFIKQTVDSVLQQSYANFEFIIIDDHSQDSSSDIINSYKDKRINIIRLKENVGAGAARNEGIKRAVGRYIAFLDSDDMWLPEKLEKQIKVFQASNETAMLYTRFRTIEGEIISNRIFPENRMYKSGNMFKSIYLRNLIACSSVMVKRSVLDQVGLFNTDPNLIAIEDADLWLRIALKYNIKCTDDLPLLIYRIHSQSISQGFKQRTKRSIILRKRYKKYAGNYLFCMAVLLKILRIIKQ